MEVREARAAYATLPMEPACVTPPGYKRTEAGVIPADWHIANLGALSHRIYRGASPRPIDDPVWFDERSSIGWVRISDVTQSGRYLFETTQRLSSRGVRCSRYLPRGALIMSICATVGRPIETRIDVCIHDGFVVFERPTVEQGFLYQVLKDLEPKWSSKGQTGSQMNLNTGLIKSTQVPLPPTKAEQEAIAEALSDADTLIESLQQLIAKKRQIKQGSMQALLTGKQRLPGFSGEFETRRLDELGRWTGGMTPSMSNPLYWKPGTIPWISSGDVKSPRLTGTSQYVTTLAVKEHATTLVPENSIVVVMRSGILRKFLPVAMNLVPMAINQDLKALIPDSSMCAEYVLHALIGNGSEILARCLKSGTTVESVEFGWLKALTIFVPSLAEQTAIATVLSDMDTELAELETRLAKTRELKQGMMQVLLTGRIRLVQPASNLVPLPKADATSAAGKTGHNRQIHEAVVIAMLTQRFGSEEWPLARVRRTKFAYLLHRHVEGRADGFLKKAAGPYDPTVRYKGPEGIALRNGYVRAHHNGTYEGLVASENIAHAEAYFEKWYGADALAWLESLRMKKTDELELLATVDMAIEELRREGKPSSVDAVRQFIHDHAEWRPKLDRAIFSESHIAQALAECHALFGR